MGKVSEMKKNIIALFAVLIILLCSCESNIDVGSISENRLKYENIEDCKITKLCNIKDLNYEVDKVSVTEKELKECVEDEIEKYYRYEEIDTRDYVKRGDYITISYISKSEDKIIDKNDKKHFKVGEGNFDIQAEEKIIGAKKGKRFKISITVPKDEKKEDIAGKEEIMDITVLSIKKLVKPDITDEWIKKHYNFNTVDEFYKSVKKSYIQQEQAFADLNAREKLITEAINASDFDLNNDSVLAYAKNIYYDTENSAAGYGTELEEYIKSFYDVSIDEFYQKCYDDSEAFISRVLLIGAISEKNDISISKGEINHYIKIHDIDKDEATKNEMSIYKYEVLENKVIDYIIDEINKISFNKATDFAKVFFCWS